MTKFTMGSTLYQIQNGKPKLIAYESKRLPEAARNYSIVDHLALTYIIKCKVEPATVRIKRFL